MNSSRIPALSLFSLVLIASPTLNAQESTGQIVGSVKDKAGVPIPDVEVRLTSSALQGSRIVRTDSGGLFRAPLLPPGTYQVMASKGGYIGPKIEVNVGLGQVVRTDVAMFKPQTSETFVEVVASASSVDKTDVKTSTNISAEFMNVIPRTNRGMDTVALLAPGVTLGVGGRVQMRGGQTTANRFLLNGTDISDNVFGNTDGRAYYVDDSVAETQIIQSPVNPRYGNFTGGIINAITKTGSNEFTGNFRGSFSRTSWSASAPLGGFRPGTGLLRGNVGVSRSEDALNRSYALWLGGPIIKDRLWFAVSTKLDPATNTPQTFSNVSGFTTGDGSGSPAYITANSDGPFVRVDQNTFYELKLTYALTPNHTFELAGNRNSTAQVNRFYVLSFDPATLVPQDNKNEYQTLSYRGVFGSSFTVEARYALKHQLLSAGGNPAQGDPIRARYSNGSYYIFENGIFDKTDGGDNRDITTWTVHAQWFSPQTSLGTHVVEGGFEILNQDRQAANAQSPTGRQFFVWGRNADGTYRAAGLVTSPTAFGQNSVFLYLVDKGVAKTQTQSFYASDTWSLNDHWQALLGGRFDKVAAKDTLGSETISSSRFSPRFQITFDPKGDQSWLIRGSWARYVGKLSDGFTNLFTRAGSPITESFGWRGARNDALTVSQLRDLANWNINFQGFQGQTGPGARLVAKDTKAPYADEASASIRRTFTDGSFLAFTYTNREWHSFFNDFFVIGDERTITPRFFTPLPTDPLPKVVLNRWASDDNLKRDYKSLEFEFLTRFGSKWSMGGNWTYAILRGNGEGSEGGNPPVQGDVIGDYQAVHDNTAAAGQTTFQGFARTARGRDFYAPEGYLTGDQRQRGRIHLDFLNISKTGGQFNASLLFNYNGGFAYSLTRGLAFEARSDATALAVSNPAINPNLYPNTYTRFYGPRGIGRFNDTYSFDLKLGVEVPLWKRLRFLSTVTAFNVFNHWQVSTYDTGGITGTSLATNSPMAGFSAQARSATVGNNTGFGTYGAPNFAGGRSVVLSTGFKW